MNNGMERMAERNKRGRAENVIQNALTALPSILEDISGENLIETSKEDVKHDATLLMRYYTSTMARTVSVTQVPPPEQDVQPMSLMDWMFDLTKTNMKSMYDGCEGWGWDDDGKYKELDHEDARFLVVSCSSADSSKRSTTRGVKKVENPVAFVHMRYETEARVPIVYVYEIQVSKEHRGLKLGWWLMKSVEALGQFFTFSLVMLTVFCNNVQAREFYSRLGYSVDPSSPAEDCQDNPGYLILSKRIDSMKKN